MKPGRQGVSWKKCNWHWPTPSQHLPTCVFFWGGKMVAMNPWCSYCCNARCLSCDSDVDSQWDWSLTEVSAFGHCPIGRIFWYFLPWSGHGYWLRHVETTLPPKKLQERLKHLAFPLGPRSIETCVPCQSGCSWKSLVQHSSTMLKYWTHWTPPWNPGIPARRSAGPQLRVDCASNNSPEMGQIWISSSFMRLCSLQFSYWFMPRGMKSLSPVMPCV